MTVHMLLLAVEPKANHVTSRFPAHLPLRRFSTGIFTSSKYTCIIQNERAISLSVDLG